MLNVDPKNLRGIGIQVAKLDKPNEPTKGQNKSILNFLTAKSPVKPPVLNDSQEPGPSNAFKSNPASTTEVCINVFFRARFNLNSDLNNFSVEVQKCWELSLVIFFNLRKKELLANLSNFKK